MFAWGVVSAAYKAMVVIPGVFARSAKVGAFGLGEPTCPLMVAVVEPHNIVKPAIAAHCICEPRTRRGAGVFGPVLERALGA
jgi:hypothetical protein